MLVKKLKAILKSDEFKKNKQWKDIYERQMSSIDRLLNKNTTYKYMRSFLFPEIETEETMSIFLASNSRNSLWNSYISQEESKQMSKHHNVNTAIEVIRRDSETIMTKMLVASLEETMTLIKLDSIDDAKLKPEQRQELSELRIKKES